MKKLFFLVIAITVAICFLSISCTNKTPQENFDEALENGCTESMVLIYQQHSDEIDLLTSSQSQLRKFLLNNLDKCTEFNEKYLCYMIYFKNPKILNTSIILELIDFDLSIYFFTLMKGGDLEGSELYLGLQKSLKKHIE